MKQILLAISLFSSTCISVKAQESETKNEESFFKFSTSYLSNSVYNGRKDSLTLPYLTPSITYYNKSGFYIGGSVWYSLAQNDKRIDLFTFDAGYDFSISDQFSAGLYAAKYFYNSNSNAVRSETKGSVGATINYDPGIITLYTGIDFSFASKTDINITTSILHEFSFGDDGNAWSITPSITMNAGTQNAYQDFVFKRKKGFFGNNTITLKSSNKFNILDYEFSLPITYDKEKVGFFFTPTYAIPQNAVYFTRPNGTTFTVEKLENNFYAEFGVYLKF